MPPTSGQGRKGVHQPMVGIFFPPAAKIIDGSLLQNRCGGKNPAIPGLRGRWRDNRWRLRLRPSFSSKSHIKRIAGPRWNHPAPQEGQDRKGKPAPKNAKVRFFAKLLHDFFSPVKQPGYGRKTAGAAQPEFVHKTGTVSVTEHRGVPSRPRVSALPGLQLLLRSLVVPGVETK